MHLFLTTFEYLSLTALELQPEGETVYPRITQKLLL